MAIPWLMALKVVPWGDVLEHAPAVLKSARKLMERQKEEPFAHAETAVDLATDQPPSLGELKNRLIAAQLQLDQHAQTQAELAQAVAELAEQNARLVGVVDALRVRTRGLVAAVALLTLAIAGLAWRVMA